MTLDLELLSFCQTYLDFSITLDHCLQAILDLFLGSSKLIKNSKGLISIGFISIPLSGKFV